MQVSLYTDTQQLMGTLNVPYRRLTDVLTQESVQFVLIEDCLVVSLQAAAEEDRLLPSVQVNRDHILFAIQHSAMHGGPERMVAPSATDPLVRVAKQRYSVGAMVGNWQIEGHLHLLPDADPQTVLAVTRDSFLPLTEAVAARLTGPRLRIGPETIIVQREKIATFWFTGEDPIGE